LGGILFSGLVNAIKATAGGSHLHREGGDVSGSEKEGEESGQEKEVGRFAQV
jgi:hypothetical protein